MNNQRTSACRVVSITSVTAVQRPSEFARICNTRAINLAEMAESIRANQKLCYIVTEAARNEFGWNSLRVEDAIVLLGGQRLSELLSSPKLRGRSSKSSLRKHHNSSTAAVANLCLLGKFQGEPK